jgi:hypothetical protein
MWLRGDRDYGNLFWVRDLDAQAGNSIELGQFRLSQFYGRMGISKRKIEQDAASRRVLSSSKIAADFGGTK